MALRVEYRLVIPTLPANLSAARHNPVLNRADGIVRAEGGDVLFYLLMILSGHDGGEDVAD